MPGIGDTGISPSYKRPAFIAKIVYAAGASGAGSQRLRTLLIAPKTAAGSLTPDVDIVKVSNEDEADAYAGVGSPLARMAYKALKVDSADVWIAAVTEATGTKATATITPTGPQTSAGTLRFRLAGVTVVVSVGLTDTIATICTNIAAAFNANSKLPAVAAATALVVTLTWKTNGTQGKLGILYRDAMNTNETVAGLAVALAGSASINTNGVYFGAALSGTGVEDLTTLLTKLTITRYARIAVGVNDATNAALVATQVNTNGGPLALLEEQFVMGHNGTYANAQTLAQTTLNAFLGSVIWIRNCESHPAEIAAWMAAKRSVTEQTSPVPDYDNLPMDVIAPQAFDADVASPTEQDTALNNGVTPAATVNGKMYLVRAITSYCLFGGSQDERCLDIGDPTMAQYAALDLKAMYDTEFRPANPLVGPNPDPNEESPPQGVGFPDLWNSLVTARAQDYYRNGWLQDPPVGVWAPKSDFNKAGRFIVDELPLSVRRVQHRLDQVVRQVFNSV
jgi:phage tail sheath gpL-like